MADVRKPDPAKLIVGMLSARAEAFDTLARRLCELYGPVDIESPLIPFTFTDYYEKQMGPGLLRKFIAFGKLIDPAALADIKLRTNALEAEVGPIVSTDVPRAVNVDPGYLTLAKLVLASAKDFSHRVYLRDGIFAEVTLHYDKTAGGTFRGWPWTFPDYKTSAEYHAFLLEARRKLAEQLRMMRG